MNRNNTVSGQSEETPAVMVQNLRKTFGNGDEAVTAVDDVSFKIEQGEIVGLLGPNGAGKTTIIKSILGLVLPDSGEVRVNGTNVLETPAEMYQSAAAMLEGARNTYWRLTVRENLQFFTVIGGSIPTNQRKRHDELLRMLELEDRADTVVNDLSRGMKGKVSLAVTLARDTPIVFLDEPTLGLDVEASYELQSELRRLADDESRTILVSSHDMEVIEKVCDRVIILYDGIVLIDKQVEALLDLFKTQAFQLTLGGRISWTLRDRLEREYDLSDWKQSENRTIFEIILPDNNAVYDLMEILRSAGVDLIDIKSVDPDLEEVFLSLIDQKKQRSK